MLIRDIFNLLMIEPVNLLAVEFVIARVEGRCLVCRNNLLTKSFIFYWIWLKISNRSHNVVINSWL